MSDLLLSFVVIGLDEAGDLGASIASISGQGFERDRIEILYVDSGSRDASVEIARAAGVDRLLSIPRASANAARARNAGLEEVRAPYVQFVDGDTKLEPGWARTGLQALEADSALVAVEGDLCEVAPANNLYDAVCELDWPASAGPVDYVGGNSLYRVAPLRAAGGFDPAMRVGEEPELGVRLRGRGGRMQHLGTVMARHHLDIRSLREYLRRNYTSGVACAMVAQKTGGLARGYWSGRLWRTLGLAGLFTAPVALALPLSVWAARPATLLFGLGPALLLTLAARKAIGSRERGVDARFSVAFGFHTYVSKLPAALGILSVLIRETASLTGRPMTKTIFLDRDDTIVPDRDHLDNVEGIELLDRAGEGLREMMRLGFKLVLITNQSGIGRGYFPESMVDAQHARLTDLLSEYGVTFDAIRYCPHLPDAGCACRKPMPGMLLDAGRELGTDFERSWMIGNSESDVEAGRAAGCRTIQIIGEIDLAEAARLIAEDEGRR